nr:MAG TPA: hypothetical protein [Caudoviricetes sp.]
MELKIGKNTYQTIQVTGDFPIKFYKKTGYDIFALDADDLSILKRYEILLNVAHTLIGRTDTVEEFASEFTMSDLIGAYTPIVECYMETTEAKVEDKTEKK